MGYLSRTAQSSWCSWPSTKAPLYSVSVSWSDIDYPPSLVFVCSGNNVASLNFNARFPLLLDNRESPWFFLSFLT
ncbi:hypothetical protein CGRA01v4_09230 [Colletotrichum graminicola]|nr:hypothetical protein CGRA01v4_09230 [Colletotrichum graminicola]